MNSHEEKHTNWSKDGVRVVAVEVVSAWEEAEGRSEHAVVNS